MPTPRFVPSGRRPTSSVLAAGARSSRRAGCHGAEEKLQGPSIDSGVSLPLEPALLRVDVALAGLKSRCSTPASWATWRARARPSINSTTRISSGRVRRWEDGVRASSDEAGSDGGDPSEGSVTALLRARSPSRVRAMSRASVSPSSYCMAMKKVPSRTPLSYTVQMPGWSSREATSASRWKRRAARPSRCPASLRTFSATCRPSPVCSAR